MELTNTCNQHAELSQPAGDPRQAEIARLVQNLNSLEKGERTAAKLMAYGRLAIEPLRLFLFEGKPSVVYQPRRWAVEALAAIGAKEVLIDYLKWKKEIPDPAVRFGEEPVENAAARALAAWQTDEVFETLLDVSRRRSQLGFVEALGQFRRAEAIPYFIRALEDDICRSAAEESLRKLGATAARPLVEAALARRPSPEEERPSSVRRRIGVLRLLAEIELTQEFWQRLRPLISDSQSGIAIAISNIAVNIGDHQDKVAAVERLLEILPSADWYDQGEIETCLVGLYPVGRDLLEAELATRNALPDERRVMDRALQTLLRVKRQVDAAGRTAS
jgi:hypothetical protein